MNCALCKLMLIVTGLTGQGYQLSGNEPVRTVCAAVPPWAGQIFSLSGIESGTGDMIYQTGCAWCYIAAQHENLNPGQF